MRPRSRLLSALVLVTTCSIAGACGGTRRRSSESAVAFSAGYVVGDADDDDRRRGREPADSDDGAVRGYGRLGSAGQAQAIEALLKRYYAAAASEDGAAACRLLSHRLARGRGLRALVPAEYRPAQDSTVLRNGGCAQAESLIFSVDRQQLQTESATMSIAEARVDGRHALAIMRFGHLAERQITLAQEHDGWRIDALIDGVLP